MYMTEYEERKEMWGDYGDYGEERLSDTMYRMCSNIVPLEWPDEWKSDPQILTGTMKDDIDFCSMVFSEYLDQEH
jgi:hypothetical protein